MCLFDKIDEYIRQNWRANVVISGITCSGKTTLANSIKAHYNKTPFADSVSIIPQDEFFKDLAQIPKSSGGFLTDSIEAFHTDEYEKDVKYLLQFDAVLIPQYDIAINSRKTETIFVWNNPINVFEGLHTIEILKRIPDTIKVFVDTDPNICLQRRIARDTSKFGVSEKRIREYWEECIMPMSEKYIYPQRAMADIIYSGGE